MQRVLTIGMVAVMGLAVAGCGVAARTAPAVKSGAVGVRAQAPLGMKQAFAKAQAHMRAVYGDDFRPVQAYADDILDTEGRLQPATWRFNMVGHLRGQAGYSLVKVQIKPDGSPFVDPKRGGPFPDRNNNHLMPQLDLANMLDPETAGWNVVLAEGYGRKYPPTKPVSWKALPSDRLKQTVMVFDWYCVKKDGFASTNWMVDTSIDPMTGEVIENGAYK